jgi:hypothetical protein
VRLEQELLPLYAQLDAAVHLPVRLARMPEPDARAGVVRRLEQPRYELHLIGADQRRRLLQADQRLEPARQHVAVLLPPPRGAGLPGEREVLLAARRIDDSVEREQVGDVPFLGAYPAQLQAADLGVRPADGIARGLPADAARLAQPAQVRAEDDPQHRRPAPRMGEKIRHRGGAACLS